MKRGVLHVRGGGSSSQNLQLDFALADEEKGELERRSRCCRRPTAGTIVVTGSCSVLVFLTFAFFFARGSIPNVHSRGQAADGQNYGTVITGVMEDIKRHPMLFTREEGIARQLTDSDEKARMFDKLDSLVHDEQSEDVRGTGEEEVKGQESTEKVQIFDGLESVVREEQSEEVRGTGEEEAEAQESNEKARVFDVLEIVVPEEQNEEVIGTGVEEVRGTGEEEVKAQASTGESEGKENPALEALETVEEEKKAEGEGQEGRVEVVREKGVAGAAGEHKGGGTEREAEGGREKADTEKREEEGCPLGLLYVYDFPRMFNEELVEECDGSKRVRCKKLQNGGLGPIIAAVGEEKEVQEGYKQMFGDMSCWFSTYMTRDWASTEPVYHARMLQQPCRTEDPEKASVFYLPYYAAIALERVYDRENNTLSNELPRAFTAWLAKQPYFVRNGGHDHFMAMGAGVWNFMNDHESASRCNLLKDPVMENVTKLTHDRDPWDRSTAGIPYPVFFHPSTDDQIRIWQQHVLTWPRKNLASVSKAGGGASAAISPSGYAFQEKLMDLCKGWDRCKVLECPYVGDDNISPCQRPRLPMQLAMDSDFCLQPPGDTMPRKSVFDAMVAGCIPVFFKEDSAYTQYLWYLPRDRSSYSVFVGSDQVEDGSVKIRDVLATYTPERIAAMRSVIVNDILPSLVTGNPNDFRLQGFKDAVSRTVEGMMIKVDRYKRGLEHQMPNPYMLGADSSQAYEILQIQKASQNVGTLR